MLNKSKTRKRLAWYLMLSLLFSYSVSYSDGEHITPVEVTNSTEYDLDVTLNGDEYVVKPKSSVKTEVKSDKVLVLAAYSPGQNVSGDYAESFETSGDKGKRKTTCSGDCTTEPTKSSDKKSKSSKVAVDIGSKQMR